MYPQLPIGHSPAKIPGMLREAVISAMQRTDVIEAVRAVYTDLASQIEARKPICRTSGRCCRFDEFGHRLYVTTMELAAFVAEVRSAGRGVTAGGCPFQVDGLCSVHSARPFGCRIFFCDPTAKTWQEAQYEAFHRRIKRLHDVLDVPYFYVEWRFALAEVDLMSQNSLQSRAARLSLPQLPL